MQKGRTDGAAQRAAFAMPAQRPGHKLEVYVDNENDAENALPAFGQAPYVRDSCGYSPTHALTAA